MEMTAELTHPDQRPDLLALKADCQRLEGEEVEAANRYYQALRATADDPLAKLRARRELQHREEAMLDCQIRAAQSRDQYQRAYETALREHQQASRAALQPIFDQFAADLRCVYESYGQLRTEAARLGLRHPVCEWLCPATPTRAGAVVMFLEHSRAEGWYHGSWLPVPERDEAALAVWGA